MGLQDDGRQSFGGRQGCSRQQSRVVSRSMQWGMNTIKAWCSERKRPGPGRGDEGHVRLRVTSNDCARLHHPVKYLPGCRRGHCPGNTGTRFESPRCSRTRPGSSSTPSRCWVRSSPHQVHTWSWVCRHRGPASTGLRQKTLRWSRRGRSKHKRHATAEDDESWFRMPVQPRNMIFPHSPKFAADRGGGEI